MSQFTAPDLSAIARELDQLEESYDDDNSGRESTNMDDTGTFEQYRSNLACNDISASGFFSVQVLEDALKVWGLKYARSCHRIVTTG